MTVSNAWHVGGAVEGGEVGGGETGIAGHLLWRQFTKRERRVKRLTLGKVLRSVKLTAQQAVDCQAAEKLN